MQTIEIIEIVRSTRSISLPHFGSIIEKDCKSDSAFDVVTQIDQDIETYLQRELKKIAPEIAFVGEEFGGERNKEVFWLVDPIDGTGHYMRGIPYCTTMLALIENGHVTLSIIYDFVRDIMYHAELGKGSYMNGTKISVSERHLNASYMCCEIQSRQDANKDLMQFLERKTYSVHHICAGYEYVLVATGKIEGRIVYDGYGKDYDYAPGSLLVSEAGGVVRNFKSDTYNYANLNFIACNQNMYRELVDVEDSIEGFMR